MTEGDKTSLVKKSRPPATVDGADDVLEGEIVEEPRTTVAAVRAVVYVATHHRTLAAARQVVYVGEGAAIVIRRLWDARTVARYQRAMRTAEAIGDHQAMLEWEVREATFRKERHKRRMDLLTLPIKLLQALPKMAVGALGLLLAIGALLAVADQDPSRIDDPIKAVASVVAIIAFIISVAWGPLLLAGPWVAVLWLWSVGRRGSMTPTWLATSANADVDLSIDETTIARALEALRIPQITNYLKEGLPLQFIVPARQDGRGTHAVLRLPAGVTAERIARRRPDLASGLYRLAKETWPTTGDEAGILDLWVADKGALAEGAGPYPLLEAGFTDVFKGVPFGRTLRGDPVLAPLIGRNTIIGGMPEQGKSSAARVIMAGAALDPTAELRIWVPDANYDFEVFERRCSRYVMGAEGEKIEQIRDDLRELHAEVQTRGDLLVQHQEPEVTRALADRVPGLHPLFCLLEEAHVAFGHKIYGEEISWLYVEIVRLGRKRGIHMIPSTQAPTAKSIPRDVTRNCTNGVAFAVGDHVANDALLGQGAYAAGHRATELIPGTDCGTALCKGFSGQRSQINQVYFLSVSRSNDQVTPLIDRVLAEIERRGRSVPGTDRPRPDAQARDLLDDLDEVLDAERVKLADVPALLRDLAPEWPAYRQLTGTQLRARLKDLGVRVTNSGNVLRLDPYDVRAEIGRRAAADLDEV